MVKHEPALGAFLRGIGAERALTALGGALSHAAMFVVDRDQRIVWWSEGATRLLGYSAEELVGEHCLKGNRCATCMRGCGIQEHGTVDGVALEMVASDGRLVPVRKYAAAFFDDAGVFQGGVEVLLPAGATEDAPVRRGGGLPILPADAAALEPIEAFHGIVTADPAMQALFQTARNVAATDVTVLLRGESGTGKELFARAIHDESARKSGPFLAVNCAAVTPSLLESELFGHERGAFTGAFATHHGLFERADAGTLFLDEVAELPLELQAKLLRVLEERSFFRVGGHKPISVDVRIIAATHRALRKEAKAGRFREDLLYRLRVVPLFLPPLRERSGDVPLLVQHFIDVQNARAARTPGARRVTSVSPDAMRALVRWAWPGNVRELKNAVDYAFAVARGDVLELHDLPAEIAGREPAAASSPTRDVDEAQRIRRALADADGNINDAARALGMSRATFWRRRKQLGLE